MVRFMTQRCEIGSFLGQPGVKDTLVLEAKLMHELGQRVGAVRDDAERLLVVVI